MKANPHKLDKLRAQALNLFQSNRAHEAGRLYADITSADPTDVQSWHMLSAINGMLGRYQDAEVCCRRVIALQPRAHGAHINLANVLAALGRLPEAETSYKTALSIQGNDPQTFNNLGNLLSRMGRSSEASAALQRAIQLNPSYPEPYNNYGVLLWEQGDNQQASKYLRKAIELNPGFSDAYANLGNILVDLLEYDQAEKCYQQALAINPGDIKVRCNIGKLHQTRGDFDKAQLAYKEVLRIQPDHTEAITALAILHERRGNHIQGKSLLEPVINNRSADPKAIVAYANICRRLGDTSRSVQLLEGILQANLSPRDLPDVHFLLGDLYDASGDYAKAFDHYRQGNLLDKRASDLDQTRRRISALKDIFTKDSLPRLPRSTQQSELPVYIVGMPRSGTSLVEQILASHPLVHGAGEMCGISEITQHVGNLVPGRSPYPPCIPELTSEHLDSIANNYLQTLSRLSPGATRITDKTPHHFLDLGFINLLVPGARVIHCTRDPLDTCLSIYFHRFNAFHTYATDLSRLGEYHRLYRDIMQHWTSVLDIRILEVPYEELVANQETISRRMIEFIGLEWQDGCLRFFENKRDVNTPSYDQVRQPIYNKSVARWKKYEDHIGELRQALGQL